MTTHRLKMPFKPLLMIILALFALTVQGCFHSSSSGGVVGITPDADPTGYYDVSGTAMVDGGMLEITDLQAMVNDNRIMMMSTEKGLLYDGIITDISGNGFTADFTIYTDGENPITATASGSIFEKSIEGTLSGSGAGSGTFELFYAEGAEQQVADLTRIENRYWDGDAAIGPNYAFNINMQGVLTDPTSAGFNVPIFDGCGINGTVTPINDTSLYEVDAELTNCDVTTVSNTNYTGFAVSRTNVNVDDTLVLVLSNGTYSPNGELIVN